MLFLLLNLFFWSKISNKNDMVRACRNFINIFPRPLFIIIFRPEMLKGVFSKPSGNCIVSPNLCFLSYLLIFHFAELCKVSARLDNIDIRNFIRVLPSIFFYFLIYQKFKGGTLSSSTLVFWLNPILDPYKMSNTYQCCPILLKLCTSQQNEK